MEALLGTGGGNAPVGILLTLTLIGMSGFILVMMTSFVRIVVVLSLLRTALGAQTVPSNMVVTGLALVLTMITMMPTLQRVNADALVPYQQHRIHEGELVTRALVPMRAFMLAQTRKADLDYFGEAARADVRDPKKASLLIVIPSFVVGELRAAFAIGLSLYLPFLAIDLIVSAIIMGLGMMMLSPNVVSLPIKLLLFVSVDGWTLVCGNLIKSFHPV